MLIAIYIVLFLALTGKGINPYKVFASSSFAMLILTIILYPTGLISGFTLIIFSVLFPVSVFILWVWGGTST